MKMRLGCATLAFVISTSAAADCLSVKDHNVNHRSLEFGLVEVEWQAEVNNSCDAQYSGFLTVEFLDAEGRSVHRQLTAFDVASGQTVTVGETSRIDENRFERVEKVEWNVEGDEMPQ